MPYRSIPPGRANPSNTATGYPRRASWYAHDNPAGPAPTTATRSSRFSSESRRSSRPWVIPKSPTKRSRALIATAPSFVVRLHPSSHGCGQTRPQTAGNGFRSVMIPQASAYACSGVRPYASAWAIVVSQPRMSVPPGHVPPHGGPFGA